jgi:alcohol dehydrogenase class IV
MPSTWRFSTSDEILFGNGAVAQTGAEAAFRGLKRALIVTDGRLRDAGVLDPVTRSLDAAGIAHETFTGGVPEPSDVVVDAAGAAAAAFKPDLIIGLGGGSNMDIAKVAAALATHGGRCADYFGENKIPGRCVPVFAIPTTAGTGSEVTAVAVVEDSARNLKLAVASPFARPALAIADPQLTLSCPPRVTAESGMDALVHAVEAMTVVPFDALDVPLGTRQQFSGQNPLTDALAERAIRLIGQHLRTAVYQPKNLAAREGMLLAALLAGMAFSSAGLSSVHALQYPVAAVTHTTHGLGTGLLLPYVVEFLLPSNPAAFASIAGWLGDEPRAERCAPAIQRLKADIGMPMHLRDIGVSESHIPAMAEQAMTYARLVRMSARALSTDALTGILCAAL